MIAMKFGIEVNVIDIEKTLDFYSGKLGFGKYRDEITNEWIVEPNGNCFIRLKQSYDVPDCCSSIYIGLYDFDSVVSQLNASDKVIRLDKDHRSLTLLSPDNHKIVLKECLVGDILQQDFSKIRRRIVK